MEANPPVNIQTEASTCEQTCSFYMCFLTFGNIVVFLQTSVLREGFAGRENRNKKETTRKKKMSLPPPVSRWPSFHEAKRLIEHAQKGNFVPDIFAREWKKDSEEALRHINRVLEKDQKKQKVFSSLRSSDFRVVFVPATETNLPKIQEWLKGDSASYLCRSWLQPNMFRTGSLCNPSRIPIKNSIDSSVWLSNFVIVNPKRVLVLLVHEPSNEVHGVAVIQGPEEKDKLSQGFILIICSNNGVSLDDGKTRAALVLYHAVEDWMRSQKTKMIVGKVSNLMLNDFGIKEVLGTMTQCVPKFHLGKHIFATSPGRLYLAIV